MKYPRVIYFPESDDRVLLDRTALGVIVARLIGDDGEPSAEYGTGDSMLDAVADLNEALAGAEYGE